MRISTVCPAAMAMALVAGTVYSGLIDNGDFELGSTGFTTQYTYTADLTPSGTIFVGFDPQDHHPLAVSYGDHTSGTGRMLIANGSFDGNATIWGQTVSVKPNTEYAFLYWLSGWATPCVRQAQIRCLINEVRVGAAGFTGTTAADWSCVLLRWNSGSASEAAIRLADRTGTEADNDFSLDDIEMVEVGDNCVLVTAAMPGGTVDAPGRGVFVYPQGEAVSVEARCESGYEFAYWGGDVFDPSPIMQVDMSTDRVVIARFRKLDYGVTMQASGSAPNEFLTCEESADRLALFQGALAESLHPAGLVVGERKGMCYATYRFPILKPRAGIQDITRIAVNVYGGILSAGPKVKVGDNGPYTRFKSDLQEIYTGQAVADLLGQSEGPVCWLPVKVAAVMGTCDLEDVYVSYDCPSIPRPLLRRFHDHLSVYQALESYARAQDLRDLFGLEACRQSAWEAMVRTLALAQDLGGCSDTLPIAIGAGIEGLDDLLARWQSLADSGDLNALAGCNSEAIVTCLDAAVSSGGSYIAAYADAVADGRVLADEASQLNRGMAQWRADLTALNTTMADVFCTLGDVHRSASSTQLSDTAEKMIRAMTPWRTGEPDESGFWTVTSPTYLEEIIATLQDFPAEDMATP